MTVPAIATPDPAEPGAFAGILPRLAAPRTEIEREFLEMGEQLISCARHLDETSETYAKMPAALSGPDFLEAVDGLRGISDRVHLMLDENGETQAFLAEIGGFAEGISEGIATLPRLVQMTRLLTTNARVVAATVGDSEGDLSAFTVELKTSSGTLAESVSAFAEAFARMRASLHAASRMNAAFAARNEALVSRIKAELARNLGIMEEHGDRARSQASAHAERTQRISAGLSRAVGTLQIGDSTRQRVEHIEQSLEAVSRREDPGTIATVCRLQAAQVEGAIADFDAEMAVLITSLDDLARDTSEMLRSANDEAASLLSAGNAAFGAIADSLTETVRMLDEYERERAILSEAVDDLAAAVGTMLGYIETFHSIGHHIRLDSLNATIRCSRLGNDGRAFRQVAQELRNLTEAMAGPVKEVTENLESTSMTLSGFLDARADQPDHAAGSLRETIETTLRRVEDTGARLRDLAGHMAEKGPEAEERLRITAAKVSGKRDFCRPWRDVAAELTVLAAQDDPDDELPAEREQVLAEMFERYTMNAEREIHRTLFGGDTALQKDPAETEGSSLDDIFF